uniref:WAT1-related protein n=1 Tax=Kalanchoe fedtschenkoi TaxID=63787 RepID=A0A7N0UVG2_KALFE
MGASPVFRKLKPHAALVLAQMGATFLYFISEASFNRGLDPKVYTTYRLIIGGFAALPLAYFIEKQERPKLTPKLFGEIVLLSITGTSLPLSLFYASLRCTSPAFVAAMLNTVASTVFILAVILRMERLRIRSPHGIAKVAGSALSLAGVTVMTLYRGLEVGKFKKAPIHIEKSLMHENWVKGSIFAVASCLSLSLSCILQGKTLRKYPTQLSLTVWMNVIGALGAATFAGLTLRKPEAWLIGFGLKMWSVLYGGVVGSGLLVLIQLWCLKAKGPVFTTMFNPLGTVMSVFVAHFLVGEKLYIGSIIGGVTVMAGLYLLLWGKEREGDDQESTLENEAMPDLSPSPSIKHGGVSIEIPEMSATTKTSSDQAIKKIGA